MPKRKVRGFIGEVGGTTTILGSSLSKSAHPITEPRQMKAPIFHDEAENRLIRFEHAQEMLKLKKQYHGMDDVGSAFNASILYLVEHILSGENRKLILSPSSDLGEVVETLDASHPVWIYVDFNKQRNFVNLRWNKRADEAGHLFEFEYESPDVRKKRLRTSSPMFASNPTPVYAGPVPSILTKKTTG